MKIMTEKDEKFISLAKIYRIKFCYIDLVFNDFREI